MGSHCMQPDTFTHSVNQGKVESRDTWFRVRSGTEEGQTSRGRGSGAISLSHKRLSP